jgi:adenylate kinase
MNEMTNADFICLLNDCPSTDQEEIFMEAARRIAKLTREIEVWKMAADNGAGCDTPEGLAAFINCCNC